MEGSPIKKKKQFKGVKNYVSNKMLEMYERDFLTEKIDFLKKTKTNNNIKTIEISKTKRSNTRKMKSKEIFKQVRTKVENFFHGSIYK